MLFFSTWWAEKSVCSFFFRLKKKGEIKRKRRPVGKHALQRGSVEESFTLADTRSPGGPPGHSASSFRDHLVKSRKRQKKELVLRWERASGGLECVVAEPRSERLKDRL